MCIGWCASLFLFSQQLTGLNLETDALKGAFLYLWLRPPDYHYTRLIPYSLQVHWNYYFSAVIYLQPAAFNWINLSNVSGQAKLFLPLDLTPWLDPLCVVNDYLFASLLKWTHKLTRDSIKLLLEYLIDVIFISILSLLEIADWIWLEFCLVLKYKVFENDFYNINKFRLIATTSKVSILWT